jgi:cytochrome c oxidase cbb3-type subunit III
MGRWLSAGAFLAVGVCWWSGVQLTAYAQKADQAVNAEADHKTGPEAGKEIFESTCAGCHGLDGRGGEKGPNIATRAEITRRSDEELLGILQRGVPSAGMPSFSRLGDVQLRVMVAHLRTLQGANGRAEVVGDAEEGKKLFFRAEGCASCHMVNGAGGFLGSDLSNYGAITPVTEMREQIMNHDELPRTERVVVSTRDGGRMTGFARNEDNFSLQLQTLDGRFHFLDKAKVASVDYATAEGGDVGKKLSKSDVDALISYFVRVAENSRDGVKWKLVRKHREEED